jgi:hypothetical protein
MPDEASEVGEADQSCGERVDRKHRARRHPVRPTVLDDRHPGAGRPQFRFQSQLLHQAERVAICACDQLSAALDHIAIARVGTESAADVIARFEHRHVHSRPPQPIRRRQPSHPRTYHHDSFVRHQYVSCPLPNPTAKSRTRGRCSARRRPGEQSDGAPTSDSIPRIFPSSRSAHWRHSSTPPRRCRLYMTRRRRAPRR